MKNGLIGLGALIAVVVAVALIAPSFVDWNRYRAGIAREASDALGRTVEVRGDIGLSLLPAPILFAKDAHLANVEGASDADMVSLASLEVRVALAPLLAGTVRIDSVKLVRPVVNIEIMEGGQTNMAFGRRIADGRTRGLQPKIPLTTGVKVETSEDGGLDISVDNFVVEKGTLVYRNAVTGTLERIDDINGRFSFASLRGPVDAVASAVVRGLPVSIDLDTAAIIQGRTLPFNLDLAVGPGDVKAQFSGAVSRLDEAPQLKGKLTVDGQNLKDFVAAAGGGVLPDALRRPFGAVATVSVDAAGGEAIDLAVRLDGAQGQGRFAVTLGAAPTIDATLAFTRLDLDALLRPPPAPGGKAENPGEATSLELPAKAQPRQVQDTVRQTINPSGASASLETLPSDLAANFHLAVEALTWRGDVVRQARVNLSLANREITVNQLSALLPGGSEVALFGFVTEKDATLQFDGTVDATTNDLRGVVEWLGISTAGVAPERLRRLGFNAKLSARRDAASLTDLHVRLDGTQIGGTTTVDFADRLSIGANLTVDRLNLDAYLPAAAGSPPAQGAATPSAATPFAASPTANPMTALAPLGAFDANLRARAGALTFKGLPFNDVRIEATLLNGVLDVKSLSVGDLVGVSGSLSGAVTGLTAPADPKFKDMMIDAKGRNLATLFRMAEIVLPVPPEALGPTAVAARLNGGPRALDIAIEAQTMGGKASLAGHVSAADLIPRFDGRVALAHPDVVRLVRSFGVDYRPKGAKGGIDVAAKLSGSIIELAVSDLAGTAAGVRIRGGASLGLLGRKPRLAVALATSDLDIDAFLPQKRAAGWDERPRIQPAAFVTPGTSAAPGGMLHAVAASWSTEPIDLSPLAMIDGTIKIKSDSFKYGGIAVRNADFDSEVKDGALAIRRFTGMSYGGDLTMDGVVASDPRGARFQARYALGGADVGAAERAFGGKGAAKGSLTSEGQLAGGGRSMAEIIASLTGEGAIAVRGVDVGEGAGSGLGALGGLVSSLDRIAAATGGGRQKAGLLDLSGPYRIVNGVIAFDEFAFNSSIGDGALTGKADLPKWQIAATGEIRLAKTLLSKLVLRDPASAKPIPFELDGALDAPRVKIDVARLPGGGVRVLGLDRLRERIAPLRPQTAAPAPAPAARPVPPVTQEPAPPVAPQAQQPAPTPSAAQVPVQQEPKRADRAQDILRDILKGIAR